MALARHLDRPASGMLRCLAIVQKGKQRQSTRAQCSTACLCRIAILLQRCLQPLAVCIPSRGQLGELTCLSRQGLGFEQDLTKKVRTGGDSKATVMTRYAIAVAVLCGAVLASVPVLLLNLSLPSPVAVLLMLLQLPGGIFAHFVVGSEDFGPPLLVLATNTVCYSGIAYTGLFVLGRGISSKKMRIATVGLALPALVLLTLACFPSFNPLWPRGMAELTRQERELQEAFPVGMDVESVRTVLLSKGIKFYENTEERERLVLNRGKGESVKSAPGDRLISAQFQTEASQYPCGYDMEIVLLFGRDDKLKQQYVHRLRICP